MKRTAALVMVLALLLTVLVPAAAFAEQADDAVTAPAPDTGEDVVTLPPTIRDFNFRIGGPDSNVTLIPDSSTAWPEELPEMNVQYGWDGTNAQMHFSTDLDAIDYHHRVVLMTDYWPDHVPELDEPGVEDVSEWDLYNHGVILDEVHYLFFEYYFAYDDAPAIYRRECYTAYLQPVAATVTAITNVGDPQPEDGYLLGATVELQPEWTVGIVDDDVFTPVSGVSGCPAQGSVQWGIQDAPDAESVVEAENNITSGTNAAVLTTPEEGGEITYTAAVVFTGNPEQYHKDLYVQDEPVTYTVLWSSEEMPDTPPDVPDEPGEDPKPEGYLPPVVRDFNFQIGGPESNVTLLPDADKNWPEEAPEMATEYAWTSNYVYMHFRTDLNEIDYHHKVVLMTDYWPDQMPDLDDPGVSDVSEWDLKNIGVTLTEPQYLFFEYFLPYDDAPALYREECYVACLQPVKATVSSIELDFPEEQPEDGFQLSDTVSLRPVWTVGKLEDDTFQPLPNLSGWPTEAEVKWAIKGDTSGNAVIEAENNTTKGDTPAVLIPPAEGGSCVYTGTVTGKQVNGDFAHSLYAPTDPAELEIEWMADRQEPAIPIQSVPGASPVIEVVPSPVGNGTVLSGIPISAEEGDTVSVEKLLTLVRGPEGTHIAVKNSAGEQLGDAETVTTGCVVEVVNSAGEAVYSTIVAIRGDVLGTGMLNCAQLVRLARALNGSEPLQGAYMDAGCMLSDTDNVSLLGLIVLARMLQSAS